MKAVDLRGRIERLQMFIEVLQRALGILVELEKATDDRREYITYLHFHVTLKGRVWKQAAYYSDLREGIETVVLYALSKAINAEAEDQANTQKGPTY